MHDATQYSEFLLNSEYLILVIELVSIALLRSHANTLLNNPPFCMPDQVPGLTKVSLAKQKFCPKISGKNQQYSLRLTIEKKKLTNTPTPLVLTKYEVITTISPLRAFLIIYLLPKDIQCTGDRYCSITHSRFLRVKTLYYAQNFNVQNTHVKRTTHECV